MPSSTQLAIITAGEHRGTPRDEGERRPVGQQHRADRAEQRGHAIKPDGGERARDAERAGGLHHPGLQPVDADRLLVAHLVLEADVDIVAALHHLLGGLREARLVAIDRRDREKTGQEAEQRGNEQHGNRAPMRADGKIDDRLEIQRGSDLTPSVAGRNRHDPSRAGA